MWMPSTAAPSVISGAAMPMVCTYCSRASWLSVSRVGRKPVTPWLAKKALTLARPSLSAPFMSTPTAPWVWMSIKPGMTSRPVASTSCAPGAVSPSPTAVMQPLSTSRSACCMPSGVQTVPPRINHVLFILVAAFLKTSGTAGPPMGRPPKIFGVLYNSMMHFGQNRNAKSSKNPANVSPICTKGTAREILHTLFAQAASAMV